MNIKASLKEFLSFKYKKIPWVRLKFNIFFSRLNSKNDKTPADYLAMQKRQFNIAASVAKVKPGELTGDCVAAVDWEFQNNFPGYNHNMWVYIPVVETGAVGLEYGCGPGRNMMYLSTKVKRIDGVDISEKNLQNAKTYLGEVSSAGQQPNLYLTEGDDCGDAPSDTYDFAYSVIVLQHISVWSIRNNIFKDIYRTLKVDGVFIAQMGFGKDINNTAAYNDDIYSAGVTNGAFDVCVSDPSQIEKDLTRIGFTDFSYVIEDVPDEISSTFPQFIYFRAKKASL